MLIAGRLKVYILLQYIFKLKIHMLLTFRSSSFAFPTTYTGRDLYSYGSPAIGF